MTNKQRKEMRERLGISGHTGIKVPPSRVHGNESRRTQRRKAKQTLRYGGED